MEHHRTSGNLHVIADADTAIDGSSCENRHIVANGGASTLAITQRHQLQTIEIAANAFGIQVCSVIVFKMGAWANGRAPDS